MLATNTFLVPPLIRGARGVASAALFNEIGIIYIFNKPQRHREHREEKERGERRRDKLSFLPLYQLCRQM
jgi:hypothetical protein